MASIIRFGFGQSTFEERILAHESWLAIDNQDHDKFAAAAMLCQDASGSCIRTGICTYEGDCFRSTYATYRQASKAVRAIASQHSNAVGTALYEAAAHLDALARCAKDENT